MTMIMKIADIRTDGLQTRLALSEADVKDYAEKMDEGILFDPLVVFDDGKERYLADGFHRLEAMKRRGLTEAEVEVREGSRTEALRHSLGANAKHGRKLTSADNRHKLEIAWANQQELFGGRPSHELLAQTCAVSTKTVQRFMKRIATLDIVQGSEAVPLVSVDGKKRTALPVAPTTVSAVVASVPDAVASVPAVAQGSAAQSEEWVDKGEYPHSIFRDFDSSVEARSSRNNYIASIYGAFGPAPEFRLTKTRARKRVPREIGMEFTLPVLDDFEMFYSCIELAYDIICDRKDCHPFRLVNGKKSRPLIQLGRILKACQDARFEFLCSSCKGKGCVECGFKGFVTNGEFNYNIRQHHKERLWKEAAEECERHFKEKKDKEASAESVRAEEARKQKAADENAKEMLALLERDPIPEIFRQKMKAARPVEPADVGLTEAEVQDDLPF